MTDGANHRFGPFEELGTMATYASIVFGVVSNVGEGFQVRVVCSPPPVAGGNSVTGVAGCLMLFSGMGESRVIGSRVSRGLRVRRAARPTLLCGHIAIAKELLRICQRQCQQCEQERCNQVAFHSITNPARGGKLQAIHEITRKGAAQLVLFRVLFVDRIIHLDYLRHDGSFAGRRTSRQWFLQLTTTLDQFVARIFIGQVHDQVLLLGGHVLRLHFK